MYILRLTVVVFSTPLLPKCSANLPTSWTAFPNSLPPHLYRSN